jgi:hypothetical protein
LVDNSVDPTVLLMGNKLSAMTDGLKDSCLGICSDNWMVVTKVYH